MGQRRYVTIHFKPDARQVSDQLHNPAASYLGPKPLILMNRRLDEYESQSGHFGEKKNIFPLPEI
jgi:hypothetical protein